MKHTKGPWILDKDCRNRFIVGPVGSEVVADLTEYHGKAQAEANAQLIAAAPELLEALKRVANVANTASTLLYSIDAVESERFNKDYEFVLKTIAKAEGNEK